MATFSKRVYATARSGASRAPAPCSRPLLTRTSLGDTQSHVWLNLCGVSWCMQGFVWALQASLLGMGFDSKHDFAPPTILWGFAFALGCGVSFSGGIQHAPVYCCSVAGGNFGVLTGDECMSFYSISSGRSVSPGKAVLGIENKTYMNCYKFYMLQT